MNIILVLISTAIGAAIGGVVGSMYNHKKAEKKFASKRAIAIKALNLFLKYSKQPYKDAENEFNTSFNTSEKRAILVLLDKIGIPFAPLIIGGFNINKVTFGDIHIDKDEVQNMILQIESGNCDDLFFADIDSYFNNNLQSRSLRAIAIRYVKNVLSNTVFDKTTRIQQAKEGWHIEFTPGELNCILVFRKQTCDAFYYNDDGKFKKSTEEIIINEIEQGIWDKYLDWDIGSYSNLYSQKNLADTIATLISANLPYMNQLQGQSTNAEETKSKENSERS